MYISKQNISREIVIRVFELVKADTVANVYLRCFEFNGRCDAFEQRYRYVDHGRSDEQTPLYGKIIVVAGITEGRCPRGIHDPRSNPEGAFPPFVTRRGVSSRNVSIVDILSKKSIRIVIDDEIYLFIEFNRISYSAESNGIELLLYYFWDANFLN